MALVVLEALESGVKHGRATGDVDITQVPAKYGEIAHGFSSDADTAIDVMLKSGLK